MDPSTEKTIWRNRAEKKTKALISIEERLHHCRRSNLAKDTIKHIGLHTKLAQERHSDTFGDAAWDETERAPVAAEKRRKVIAQRRRRREKALIAVVEDIDRARKEASEGTDAQKIACLRRLERADRKRKVIMLKLQSSSLMGAGSASKHQKSGSCSLPKTHVGEKMPQNAK